MFRRFLPGGALRPGDRMNALVATPEPTLERRVEQAAATLDAPIALVTLLRDDEQLMLAALGTPVRCMPRQESFCRYAVDSADLFEVCDATSDPRFARLPMVREAPAVRYYLGAPFGPTVAGDTGALCVIDVKPRRPASRDERAYLATLARQVRDLIEQRLAVGGPLAA